MISEGQTAVVPFLATPSTHGGVAVERIDTHASAVFLAGAFDRLAARGALGLEPMAPLGATIAVS